VRDERVVPSERRELRDGAARGVSDDGVAEAVHRPVQRYVTAILPEIGRTRPRRWCVATVVCSLASVYAITLGVLLALATPLTLIAFFFFHDLWMHEGASVFKRRRVLR
jgi:hypothetical protein